MAEKEEEKKEIKETTSALSESVLLKELKLQFGDAERAIGKQRDDSACSWDEKEALLLGRNLDQVSKTTKSQVFDPRLSTIVLERAARVMAQIPTGKVQALTRKDAGKNLLLNLILQRYIVPNADAQFDLLIKFRLWDLYSNVYGSFPALVDYRVDDDYTGPDVWLIPVRSFFPQPGATTIEECDYVFVSTFVSLDWLKKRSTKTWKNIDKVINALKDKGGKTKASLGATRRSYVEKLYDDGNYGGRGDYAEIELITRYEPDRWVTYAPDFDVILRDIENPQKNNEIPIVVKHAFPLVDRFFGLGEFERGKTLQYSINSLINLYLDGVKMSIVPPVIVNPNGVVPSSIKLGEAAVRWLETEPNSIREFNISPQGMNTFQSTYSFLISALLNQAGTTNTAITRETDPGMGKTPQAIQFLAARENARDSWDRFMMEKAIERTFNLFVDLLVNKQDKPIDMHLFANEIEKVKDVFPDAVEMFESGEFGKISVKKGILQGAKYRFFVDQGTTMKKDEALENQSLTSLLTLLLKVPALVQQIPQGLVRVGNKAVDFGELLKRWIITSGVQDYDKIITDSEQVGESVGIQGGQTPVDLNQFQDPAIKQLANIIANYGNSGSNQQVGSPENP